MSNLHGDLAVFLGIVLMIIGVLLPIFGWVSSLRNNPKESEGNSFLIQDIVLGLLYLMCGLILYYQGWQLPPILLSGQFFLTASTIFWVGKELSNRFSNKEEDENLL